MVLNTSFNVFPGDPIVESPRDAIRSFLSTRGAIDRLVLEGYYLRRRACPLEEVEGSELEKLLPLRRPEDLTSETLADGDGSAVRVRVLVDNVLADEAKWIELEDPLELAILEVADGSLTVPELVSLLTDSDVEQDDSVGEDVDGEEMLPVRESDVMDRLRRLWDLTLLDFAI